MEFFTSTSFSPTPYYLSLIIHKWEGWYVGVVEDWPYYCNIIMTPFPSTKWTHSGNGRYSVQYVDSGEGSHPF